jgi:hypothetical protein
MSSAGSTAAAKNHNPLVGIFGARARGFIYFAYALLGLLFGSVQAYLTAVDASTPTWMKGAVAVYAYVGIAIGATAASNTSDS